MKRLKIAKKAEEERDALAKVPGPYADVDDDDVPLAILLEMMKAHKRRRDQETTSG